MRSLYSVYDLVHYVKNCLDFDPQLQDIYVKGEISNFTNHRSGHWYFTLKDSRSKINCVMFASYARRIPFLLKEGMKVLISGNVTMYEAGGNVQLYATNVQMDGIGELFLQLEQCKKRLNALGYFDVSCKKTLPKYPKSIGVICAKSAAATQDVLTTISRRWPICDVFVYHSLVQGANASKDLIKNLKEADQNNHDVLLLVRGGGAIEDLWCFNDEQLAITIFHLNTCIVTGVGHESDTTLVDYVSDARAATPTAAAELVTPNRSDVVMHINQMKNKLITLIKNHLISAKNQMMDYQKHRYMQDPMEYIKEQQVKLMMHEQKILQTLDQLELYKQRYTMIQKQLLNDASLIQNQYDYQLKQKEHKLIITLNQYHQKQNQKYELKHSLLQAYSPLNSLKRGYHIIYQDKKLIKSVDDVCINETIHIKMHDGEVEAIVKDKEKNNGK